MLFGISGNLLRRLQAVQNAAARLVTGTQCHEHITPVLRKLHWLPVPQRIEFKLAVLVYKVLIGLSSQYLADDCRPSANDDFDRPMSPHMRFQEHAQVWVIDYSQLLDRICGTNYLSIYMTLNILSWSFAVY